MKTKILFVALCVALAALFSVVIADAQGPQPRAPRANVGTAFTYQGQLKNGGAAVNGTCDFQFGLWDALTVGAQVGTTQTVSSVAVSNGLFTTPIDFGTNAFNGDARWLNIATRCPAGGGSYTALNPRQELTATPYALTALKTAYKNVLVVAKSGGHYNTISAALASITDNSASNRYMIWIAPGTYTETVTMKSYVDIEGAGELATKITQTGNGSASTGTVVGANNAELRFLTVENTGGTDYDNATAIYNSSASPRLTHVTANASGGITNNRGIYNTTSSPTMTEVTATGLGGWYAYGVYNYFSSPTMTNVTATSSGGTYNYGVRNDSSSTTMTNVTATGSGGYENYGVHNVSSSLTMTGITAIASGGGNNYGVYNTNLSSPTMTNVVATASAGTNNNYGVYNKDSSPTMTDVTATASGGSLSVGVYNEYSSPTMTNVTAKASGGTNSTGVHNQQSSSPTIQNSTLSGSGGTNNYGIFNNATGGTSTVRVNNSQITGSTNTIRNDSEFTTRIGASKLDGGAVNVNGGTVTCIGAYDENYTSPGYTTCP